MKPAFAVNGLAVQQAKDRKIVAKQKQLANKSLNRSNPQPTFLFGHQNNVEQSGNPFVAGVPQRHSIASCIPCDTLAPDDFGDCGYDCDPQITADEEEQEDDDEFRAAHMSNNDFEELNEDDDLSLYWSEKVPLAQREKQVFNGGIFQGDELQDDLTVDAEVNADESSDESSSSSDDSFDEDDDEEAKDRYKFKYLDKNRNLTYFMHAFEHSQRPKRNKSTAQASKQFNSLLDQADDANQGATVGDFVKSLVSITAKKGISDSALLEILSLLEKTAPGVLRTGLTKTRNGNYSLNVDNFLGEDCRKYKVHVCASGCTAYIGKYRASIRCQSSVCKTPWRYKPCTHSKHRIPGRSPDEELRERQECDPFNGGCCEANRTPHKSFYYRGVIPLVKRLITWELEDATRPKVFDYSNTRLKQQSSDGKRRLNDILDGKHARSNQKDMHRRFEKMKLELNKPDLQEVSWMFAEFYDGALLHKRKSISIWPLVISILNAGPMDRMENGIGQFLVGLHNLKLGSVAEQAMFNELFIPELQQLGNGFLFKTANNVEVWVQARLILHILDTKALEHVACIQGA